MLRDSERENDTDLFRAASQLSLLLFAKTNSYKYVRMGVSYWCWWQCASDSDKSLYKKFFFTKKTADGRTIWADRFIEWFNLDMRKYLGKHAKPNQEMLVTKTALLIKERRRWKAGNSSDSRESDPLNAALPDKSIAVSRIFCHQLDLLSRWNIWGANGEPRVGSASATTEATSFTNPLGNYPLNTQLLFDITAVDKRLSEYFDHRFIQGNDTNAVSLRMTPVKVSDVKDARIAEFTRQTSTDVKELDKVSTKLFLRERLIVLRTAFTNLAAEFPVATNFVSYYSLYENL